MKEISNKIYKNHSLIHKFFLLFFATFLIVWMLPKQGRFKYNFQQGKPWQFENLYAPFDFAIEKTPEQLETEKELVSTLSFLYFDRDIAVRPEVFAAYKDTYSTYFNNISTGVSKELIFAKGNSMLQEIYSIGFLEKDYSFASSKTCIVLENKKEVAQTQFYKIIQPNKLSEFITTTIKGSALEKYTKNYIALFFDIVKPNLKLNTSLTEKVLQEQLNQVAPVRGTVTKGTLIISKGEVIEGEKLQKLKSLEGEYTSKVWTKSNYNWIVFAYIILVSLALLMLLLFLRKYRLSVFENNTKVSFIFFNIILMVIITTLVVNYNSKYIYIVPICILPLVLKAFFDARLGLFTHVITVLLLGSIVPNSYEYMFLQIIAGIVTILTVSELYKRANLFISVAQITAIYIIAYFAFYVIHEGTIQNIHWENFAMFLVCGLATLFVQPLIYIYEKLFGLVSDVSLLELSDTNTNLLKELANKAPGTFHHSLNVANLAEAAANEIGANAMLVRVGALYHDIGKMKNPTYFTENQSTGINPHNDLAPTESAKIIINHVIDGIEIAKKNNLPDRIIDFIRTHHGTSLVYYFYVKEKEQSEEVNEEVFKYPGPKPFSKETSILMMADSVEAASKSLKEPNAQKIDVFVEQIINKQMDSKQFIHANITFKEINLIKKVLKQKLANIYHLRIEYPE